MSRSAAKDVLPCGHTDIAKEVNALKDLLRDLPAKGPGILTKVGVPLEDDPTNAEGTHLRNWIRREVVPALAARQPQIERVLIRAAKLAAQDAAAVLEAETAAVGQGSRGWNQRYRQRIPHFAYAL